MTHIGSLLAKPTVSQSWGKKLQDPRWDKLRRVVVQASPFCSSCRQGDIRLDVHHPNYDGRDPWEYAHSELVVLCHDCHEQLHESFKIFRSYASYQNAKEIRSLLGLLFELKRETRQVLAALSDIAADKKPFLKP